MLMKIHANWISPNDIHQALRSAIEARLIDETVGFVQFTPDGSRSHRNAWLIQLGTYDNILRDGGKRTRKGGVNDAGRLYAATYQEWGWLIAALFSLEHDAKIGHYDNADDFHEKTKNQFRLWPE